MLFENQLFVVINSWIPTDSSHAIGLFLHPLKTFSGRTEWASGFKWVKADRLKMLPRSNLFTKICLTARSNVAVAPQEIANKMGPEFVSNDVFELK